MAVFEHAETVVPGVIEPRIALGYQHARSERPAGRADPRRRYDGDRSRADNARASQYERSTPERLVAKGDHVSGHPSADRQRLSRLTIASGPSTRRSSGVLLRHVLASHLLFPGLLAAERRQHLLVGAHFLVGEPVRSRLYACPDQLGNHLIVP